MNKNGFSILLTTFLATTLLQAPAQEWNLQTIATGYDSKQLMRIDNNGNPHVMVDDKYYKWDGLAWQNLTLPSFSTSYDYTFCLNDAGVAHFLYKAPGTTNYLYHKYLENNVWVADQVNSYDPIAVFYGPNAGQNKPDVLSYLLQSNQYYKKIYIHKFGSTSYGTLALIQIDYNSSTHSPQLAYPYADYCTDADGNLYYVYTGVYDEIVFNFYDGTAWSSFNITDGTNDCQYPRITLDQNDIPHVSYYDMVTKDLIHAKLPAQTLAALKAGTLKSRVPSQTIAK